jgi:hypothetical protein
MRRCWSAWLYLVAWTWVQVYCAGIASAQSPDSPAGPGQAEPLQEVTVSARKLIDQTTLYQVIIPRFVKSHAADNPRSRQVGRWTRPALICPSAEGLQPAAVDYLSRRILAVAASVGAPTAKYGHCVTNVEVVFTSSPQEKVAYFGKAYRAILGNEEQTLKERLTFNHKVRAWYTTGTHTFGGDWRTDDDRTLVNVGGLEEGASRLTSHMLTGFVNVLIIVDSREVARHSIKQIADYVTMLALTRTSVEGCSELPSIIDVLSADCAGRAPPETITEADVSFLKALYASNLEMNLNIERGEMRDQMRKTIKGP